MAQTILRFQVNLPCNTAVARKEGHLGDVSGGPNSFVVPFFQLKTVSARLSVVSTGPCPSR